MHYLEQHSEVLSNFYTVLNINIAKYVYMRNCSCIIDNNNNNHKMMSKVPKPPTKAEQKSYTLQKQGSTTDRKTSNCQNKKSLDKSLKKSFESPIQQIQQKEEQPLFPVQTGHEGDIAKEDEINLAMDAVNNIISKIEWRGLDFQDSDEECCQQYFRNRRSSPQQNQVEASKIWSSDWSSPSMKSLLCFRKNGSILSGSKQLLSLHYDSIKKSQNPSTEHQSLPHTESTPAFFISPPSNISHPFSHMLSMYSLPLKMGHYYNGFKINYDFIELDGRTTAMIKNIPNKYLTDSLSKQIDSTHKDQYNFLYLPFDYDSNCNMGYAFINFIEPAYLRTFYTTYNGRKWNNFKSEKIAEITYARLQGIDELEGHFHSSKVLTQKPKNYRPIFKNSTDNKEMSKKDKNYASQAAFFHNR